MPPRATFTFTILEPALAATAIPPLPPPPPIDWAVIPEERCPSVVKSESLLTVTLLLPAPVPPFPPSETLAVTGKVMPAFAAIAIPPFPPPPPIDCATIAEESSPFVLISLPEEVTATEPPSPPSAPLPPIATLTNPPTATLMLPLPPPPPMDCARIPAASLEPSVVIVPLLSTVTDLASFPVPPFPPIDTIPTVKPALPPPPPIDWATIPLE